MLWVLHTHRHVLFVRVRQKHRQIVHVSGSCGNGRVIQIEVHTGWWHHMIWALSSGSSWLAWHRSMKGTLPRTWPCMGSYQSSATSPLFFDNLHFEHFDKNVNHESRLTLLSKCSKWRLSKNRGLVADGCIQHARPDRRRPVLPSPRNRWDGQRDIHSVCASGLHQAP